MLDPTAVRQALYERLNPLTAPGTVIPNPSDRPTRVVHGVAPAETDFPFVVFHKQSGIPTHRSFGGAADDSHLWLIKAVDRQPKSRRAEKIAAAVDSVLDFQDLPIQGGTIGHAVYLARESDVDYTETSGDEQYRHHGALYRLIVQEATE